MYAKDSVTNYESELDRLTGFIEGEIKMVCGTIGPRESGCESELKAQDYVENLMSDTADKVEREGFSLHPKAFMGWVLIDGSFMLVSSILMALTQFGVLISPVLSIVALALTVISVVLIIGEFLFYKEFLDPLFPKKNTCNVVCTRKASKKTKRRIILSGHVDSAYEWYYQYVDYS